MTVAGTVKVEFTDKIRSEEKLVSDDAVYNLLERDLNDFTWSYHNLCDQIEKHLKN